MITINTARQGVLPETMTAAQLASYPFNGGLVHSRLLGLSAIKRPVGPDDVANEARDAAQAFVTAFNGVGVAAEAGSSPANPVLPAGVAGRGGSAPSAPLSPPRGPRELLDLTHRRLDGLGGARLAAPGGSDGRSGAPAGWGHWWVDLQLETRLAIGLGNPHPLENGLSFHHTLGVPFIPGTAVKGATRAWAELSGAADDRGLARWFGEGADDAEPADDRVGGLSFLDALPLTWPRLEIDIVNCHLPAYYRGRATGGTPANPGAVAKESPVPVIFLVVAEGTTFRFRVGRRPGGTPDPRAPEDARHALESLQEALAFAGIGSKTAAGYGYFGEPRSG